MYIDEICEIRQVIIDWVTNLSILTKVRIYLYGSVLKSFVKEHSDVDIAIEILDKMSEIDRDLLWIDNHNKWESFLSEKLKLKVDLQLYEGDKTPSIKKYLEERSIILFESNR